MNYPAFPGGACNRCGGIGPQTGPVYTTLDQGDDRFITLEPGIYKEDDEAKRPIFRNVFSRATGHPFICVSRVGDRLERPRATVGRDLPGSTA